MKPVDQRLLDAIRNNAEWCDLVCRSHGVPGRFHEYAWVNEHSVPAFYPNVISLQPGGAAAEHIEALLDAGLPRAWGVKDSFACLSLEALGFRPLFEATWFWRAFVHETTASPTTWRVVDITAELAEWETAWAAAGGFTGRRAFPTELLQNENVLFVCDWQAIAGLIAFSSGPVIGISNIFGVGAHHLDEALAVVTTRYPGLPFVGYEPAGANNLLPACGFEALGPLRVWERSGDG